MKETIYNLLTQQGDMTWQQITMHILVSAVIGLFIFISYVISHNGNDLQQKIWSNTNRSDGYDRNSYDCHRKQYCIVAWYGRCIIYRAFSNCNKRFQRYCIYFLDDHCGNMLWSWRLSGCCSRQFCYFSYLSYHGSNPQ